MIRYLVYLSMLATTMGAVAGKPRKNKQVAPSAALLLDYESCQNRNPEEMCRRKFVSPNIRLPELDENLVRSCALSSSPHEHATIPDPPRILLPSYMNNFLHPFTPDLFPGGWPLVHVPYPAAGVTNPALLFTDQSICLLGRSGHGIKLLSGTRLAGGIEHADWIVWLAGNIARYHYLVVYPERGNPVADSFIHLLRLDSVKGKLVWIQTIEITGRWHPEMDARERFQFTKRAGSAKGAYDDHCGWFLMNEWKPDKSLTEAERNRKYESCQQGNENDPEERVIIKRGRFVNALTGKAMTN